MPARISWRNRHKKKIVNIIEASYLEAGDGLGNGDKLARVVGEHLSDLEGSDKNLPDKSSFRSEHWKS